MKLQAVFWDYPRFLDKDYLQSFLKEKKGTDAYYWVMKRFLEHGRVIDTLQFFTITEVADQLSILQLSDYAEKKWSRLVEVYAHPQRG